MYLTSPSMDRCLQSFWHSMFSDKISMLSNMHMMIRIHQKTTITS